MADAKNEGAAGPGPSRGKRLLFAALTLCFPLAFFLLLEGLGAWRFHRDFGDRTDLFTQGAFRYVPAAFADYTHNPGYVRRIDGTEYRYNNRGFRNEEDLSEEKPPGEVRIFILGGSAIYGERAFRTGQYQLISGQGAYPSSQTVAGHLERELQQKFPGRRIRVLNAAVAGYRINNDLMRYLTEVRSLSPDLVISVDGVNEVMGFDNPFGWDTGGAYLDSGPLVRFLRQHSYLFHAVTTFLIDSPLLDRMRGMNVAELSDAQMEGIDFAALRATTLESLYGAPPDEAILDGIVKVYRLFAEAARLDGTPALFVIQPILALDRAKTFTPVEEKLLKYVVFKKKFPPQVAQLAQELESVAAQDRDFHFLDYLGVFEDFSGDAYTDYCHLTPAANEHVAARLADYVIRHFPGIFDG